MTSTINALEVRRLLGRNDWGVPRPFGPDGWIFPHLHQRGNVIASVAPLEGVEWIHASIAFTEEMPTYEQIKQMHRAVFGGRWAYEVFAPPAEHVNIHEHARHLWGRLDGVPMLPDFTQVTGMI